MNKKDIKFNTGAIIDKIDLRDYEWGREVGKDSAPFDWSIGYDIEKEIKLILESKDQGASSSCGGFAWSYYGQVLDYINDKEYQIKSPKFIYAQTHVKGGGSAGRTNCDLVINKGWGNEEDCPSIPTTEEFLTRNDITEIAKNNALKDRALAYALVQINIDSIAQAIRDNYGCVIGITGQNNGTWRTSNPKKPTKIDNTTWNHWVYAGKVRLYKGKKQIGILNSWGDVGDNGWQWIDEEYFQMPNAIWSCWTLTPRPDDIPFKFTKTLKFGNITSDVVKLQDILKKLGYFPKSQITTRYFGYITRSSLIKFQKDKLLNPDGIFGPLTIKEINKYV